MDEGGDDLAVGLDDRRVQGLDGAGAALPHAGLVLAERSVQRARAGLRRVGGCDSCLQAHCEAGDEHRRQRETYPPWCTQHPSSPL